MRGFYYRSDVGVLRIVPGRGAWDLWINDVLLGHYASPAMAADDVYLCATGWDDWDSKGDVDEPCDLSEWERF